jgi:hypothetical protein
MGMGRDPVSGDPLGTAFPEHAPVAERIRQRVVQLPGELGPTGRAGAVEEVARGWVGEDQFGHEFECATWGALQVIPGECGVRADQGYQWYRIGGCSDTRWVLSSMT